MPVAMTVTMEMLRIIVTILEGVRKEGMVMEKNASRTKIVMIVPHLLRKSTMPERRFFCVVVSDAAVIAY